MNYCFATTAKGLEDLLIKEIEKYNGSGCIKTNGGVQFNANLDTIGLLNLHSRIASRYMIQVGFDNYQSENDIYKLVYGINWDEFFDYHHTIKITTNAIASPLKSLNFITLKVKDAICDKFMTNYQQRPSVNKDNPDIRIYVFLTNDTATIYLDTSGDALFKRGYRANKLEAPLKENLAAGLLEYSNWHYSIPLLDPMCGSGTIIIEAFAKAFDISSGINRNFAFEKVKIFKDFDLDYHKEQANKIINFDRSVNIYANDIDKRSINLLNDNLNKLINVNTKSKIKINCQDFLKYNKPQDSGIIVTNPPYGIRLEEKQRLQQFYPLLATHLKNNYANWDCWFLTSDLTMPKTMRLKPSRKIPIFNGDLECRFLQFKMVAGSNRKPIV
jgi:putative N6-adenine-specific DNA methylase